MFTRRLVLCLNVEQFHQYGLRHPPFMDKSLDELGIGSFGRIATVCVRVLVNFLVVFDEICISTFNSTK